LNGALLLDTDLKGAQVSKSQIAQAKQAKIKDDVVIND
jgi:hypothetical protein